MDVNDLTDVQKLPCGCVVGFKDDAFVMLACSLGEDCEHVVYARAEAARQYKPVLELGDLS